MLVHRKAIVDGEFFQGNPNGMQKTANTIRGYNSMQEYLDLGL
jgi:hypothetical protein